MNLPDYFREELSKCQNINEVSKLLAVVRHLSVVRAVELGYSQRKIASQFGVAQQRIHQIKNNYPLGGSK